MHFLKIQSTAAAVEQIWAQTGESEKKSIYNTYLDCIRHYDALLEAI